MNGISIVVLFDHSFIYYSSSHIHYLIHLCGIVLKTSRSNFNIMWQKMINKLNYGKRHIMELVEQATNAFDQREELCTKLQILKERGQNDRSNHVQEMRELQRKLDHDAKLQEFLAVKGQQRLNTEQEEREAEKKKKRIEEMERQFNEYDKIFQRIIVSNSIRHFFILT